MIYFILLF
jgi:hypothetical protein